MRICLIVDCYLPSPKSSAKLVSDLASQYASSGHSVTVVTPDPSLRQRFSVSSDGGVDVLRIRSGRIKGAALAQRGLNEAMLSWVLWRGGKRYFREHPCDLIVFYSPSIFFGGLVRKLKKLWDAPAYLILRDIFPQWAVDAGVIRGDGPAWRFFRKKELAQYQHADIIAVQSPGALEYFNASDSPDSPDIPGEHRLDVLYNWTPSEEPNAAKTNYRAELGLEGKVVFFYGGNIGVAQDMDNIVRLAEALADLPNVHFLLMGDGSEASRLGDLIAEKGLDNIQILPAAGQDEYFGALSEFDVGLISLAGGLTTQNIPGKLLGYAQNSMPVLASVNPGSDLIEMLESRNAGLVTINPDDAKLADCARKLVNDTELRRTIGANCRGMLDELFSVEKAAGQILRSVADIVE
jgi:O26-antigen biosynthesis N-acetyl-L-fucosamine transferase